MIFYIIYYFISSCTMHEMEDLVKGCGFYRSHRSYLINLDETINYEGMNIIMSDGTKAYLSKDKQSEFKENCWHANLKWQTDKM